MEFNNNEIGRIIEKLNDHLTAELDIMLEHELINVDENGRAEIDLLYDVSDEDGCIIARSQLQQEKSFPFDLYEEVLNEFARKHLDVDLSFVITPIEVNGNHFGYNISETMYQVYIEIYKSPYPTCAGIFEGSFGLN